MIAVEAEVVTTNRGLRLALDANDPVITGRIKEFGEWEDQVGVGIEAYLEPGWTFLDLGAHVGYFSLMAASKGNPVIAVEANPEYEELLRRNFRENGLPEPQSYAVAVSDKPGPAHLTTDLRYTLHPSASYISEEGSGIEVEARRLTDILGGQRPEFIKADIEGLEYAVFKDSPEVLAGAQVIICEIGKTMMARAGASIVDLITLLQDAGFTVTYMNGNSLDYQLNQMTEGQYTNLIARRLPETPARVATLLLCAYRSLTVETAECMLQMRDKGWAYTIGRGDALIQRVRSRVVSKWYRSGVDDVFLMIDDDVVFAPEHAERLVELAREKRAIACGAYPVKDGTHLALRGKAGTEIIFGDDQPPLEIQWPATGFMAVHRDVIKAMIPDLPLCGKADSDDAFWPFFDTFWLTGEDGRSEYLSEDYAFGERARRLGFRSWLDPSIILYHLGQYAYNVHNMPTARHIERPE